MLPATKRLCVGFGTVLILGGIAHSVGVIHLYAVKGLPDLNRLLLDVWIAEAHIAGGVLFLVGARKANPLPWILGGAIMVWTWALPFLPVLLHRAKPIFWVMPTVYSLVCAIAARMVAREATSTRTL